MTRKQRKPLPLRRFECVILIILKFGELLLWISPRILNALRSYIKHSKECFIRHQMLNALSQTCMVKTSSSCVFCFLLKGILSTFTCRTSNPDDMNGCAERRKNKTVRQIGKERHVKTKARLHDRKIGSRSVVKNDTDHMIFAVYTDNNLPRVGQKVG